MIHIGFSTQPKSWLSRIVRWFTKSKASHALIVFEMFDREWILESGIKGVVILPIERLDGQMVALVPIPELSPADLSKVMVDDLGDDYDFTGLFGMTINVLGRWFKAKWKNPWNNPRSMFCSEFVVKTLQQCGFPGADQLEAANTTPQDLLDFLTEHYVRRS